MTLLRLELVRANREIDAARTSWAAEASVREAGERQLAESLDECDLTVSALEADLKNAKRQLAVHENYIYVNPTGSFPIFASSLLPYVRHLSS